MAYPDDEQYARELDEESQILYLGRRCEDNILHCNFLLGDFADFYGEGYPVLIHKRSADSRPYIVPQGGDDARAEWVPEAHMLRWRINIDDTYYAGTGVCEIRWFINAEDTTDGYDKLKKSAIFQTYVIDSLMDGTETVPGSIIYMGDLTNYSTKEYAATVGPVSSVDTLTGAVDLTNLYVKADNFATVEEVSGVTALKNPYAITFTGNVSVTYDGSAAAEVEIPTAVTDDHIKTVIAQYIEDNFTDVSEEGE